MKPKTIFQKIWDQHIVYEEEGKPSLLYIDVHLVNEVTSPQAFEGLRQKGLKVRRPDLTYATTDHAVPTKDRFNIKDEIAKKQVEKLIENCKEAGIPIADLHSPDQGIVHVIGPELGMTLPGKVIVCGDSHTSTHGAFGTLAFGIGTSEVEHVLATQCLQQAPLKTMQVKVNGDVAHGIAAKDIILAIIAKYGTDFATGYVIEYTGDAIRKLSMEQRMTICNMSIEAGARAGLISPDEKTFEYLKGRRFSPKGKEWDEAVERWKQLATDPGAEYDLTVEIDAAEIAPQVTWGTSPGMGTDITKAVPYPSDFKTADQQKSAKIALEYMGLEPGTPMKDLKINKVFIGSCTNGRIEDLREAAKVVRGYTVAPNVTALVVPGSTAVKKQAEQEGLDQLFIQAGFEWRDAGCSMCLGMNPDQVLPGERCASTSNRNFEGRQGRGARTHLVSPAMAAAAAIRGQFVDIREWKYNEQEGVVSNGAV